jgi:hypothetical protein
VSGTIAYVADNNSGLQVIDVSNPMSPTLMGFVDTPGFARKVAIYETTALVADDNAYVLINVSNPMSPTIILRQLGFSTIYDVAVSASGVAYLATNWFDLMTLDITNPASPVHLGSIDTKGTAWAVAASGPTALVAIRSTSGPDQFSGLEMIDVSNPASAPALSNTSVLGNQSVTIDGTKIYTTGRYRIGTSNTFESKLKVIDVTNPQSPLVLGSVTTPGFIDGVAVSGTTACAADGSLRVIDVSNPSSPQIVATAPVIAVDVAMTGTMAYVAGGAGGFFIVNLSNPSAPSIAGSVDTPDNAWGIDVSGSLACVADRASGLQVIDVSNPSAPVILGSVDTPGNAMDVAISGSLAYVTDDDPTAGFQVIDLSNPNAPTVMATLHMPDIANGVAVTGPVAYVADGTFNLQVIDVSNPSSPRIIGRGPEAGNISRKIATSSQIVCMTDTGPGSNPLSILPVHCFGTVAVRVTSFHASAQPGSILLEWETSLDSDVSGFYVERSREATGEYTRVSGGLIPPASPYRFTDSDVTPGVTYFYRLEALDRTGKGAFFGPISARIEGGSMRTALGQASPNPVSEGLSTIPFVMSSPGPVKLRLLDLAGREVRLLVDKRMEAGAHSVHWDGRDNQGHLVKAGTYIYQLRTSGFESSRKLVRLR